MYVLIDLAIPAVELAEPDDTRRFHLAVANGEDAAAVEQVLAATGAGRLDPDDPDHGWIASAWVEANAAQRVGADWSAHFAKMLDKAASKGWYDAATGEIKSHVEWIASDDGSADPAP